MTTLRKFVDGLASDLPDVTRHARKKWWQRGTVPLRHRLDIIALAEAQGVHIEWDELGSREAWSRPIEGHNVSAVSVTKATGGRRQSAEAA